MIIERMAADLGIPGSFVGKVVAGASHEYKTYEIPKRSGGTRLIHHPSRRLKALQRWLLQNVIEYLPVHPAAMAYRKGVSIMDNAKAHASSRYLLRMDFTNFFPSITEADIRAFISSHAACFSGFDSTDIDVFCRLVCRGSSLTIGAPTSPALSNAICHELDARLHAVSARELVTYTRYADDMFFSTRQQDVLKGIEQAVLTTVAELDIPAQLRINGKKTRHSSKRRVRRVTGIVLGSDETPHVGRSLKRRIRALIHKLDALAETEWMPLSGLISYVIGFDPQFFNSLVEKYGLARVRTALRGKR